jgi:hypothetical protein
LYSRSEGSLVIDFLVVLSLFIGFLLELFSFMTFGLLLFPLGFYYPWKNCPMILLTKIKPKRFDL